MMDFKAIADEAGFTFFEKEEGNWEYRKTSGSFSASISIDGWRTPADDQKFWDIAIISHCLYESGDEVLYDSFEGTFEQALTEADNMLNTWMGAMRWFQSARKAGFKVEVA
jgi:hypothetical protein